MRRFAMKLRKGLPRHAKDFQSAADPLFIIRSQSFCSGRINLGELGVHRRPPLGSAFCSDGAANLWRGRRHFVNALTNGLGVKHCAAHNQRQSAASTNFTNKPGSIRHKICGAVWFVDCANIDQMVRRGLKLCGCRLCTPNIHAPINQRRID